MATDIGRLGVWSFIDNLSAPEAAAFAQQKVFLRHLQTIDQRQRKPISPGPELFHQVQRQSRAPWP